MLKIHEKTLDSGALSPVLLAERAIIVEGCTFALPAGAIEAVMNRYGAPLEDAVALVEVDAIALEAGRLRHVRHLARYDVIAKDWLVYEAQGLDGPWLAALAVTVAGALEHLARAASA